MSALSLSLPFPLPFPKYKNMDQRFPSTKILPFLVDLELSPPISSHQPRIRPMDPSELRQSPRRELQGTRPTPLKVNKDSHKIKKPPIAPDQHHHYRAPENRPRTQQHRDPVIIYAVSPKVIHTKPSEFMTLVQRLTGPNSSSADAYSLPSPTAGGGLSPTARIASFERAAASPRAGDGGRASQFQSGLVVEQWEIEAGAPNLDQPASFPGILSPVPGALPPISPTLFSPLTFDPSVLSFLHDLSPVLPNNNMNNVNNNNLVSPLHNLLSTPTVPSPGAFWDLLNQFLD